MTSVGRARAGTTPPRWLGTGGWALVQNASSRSESTTRLWFVRLIVGHASCALGVSPVVDCCNDAGRRLAEGARPLSTRVLLTEPGDLGRPAAR